MSIADLHGTVASAWAREPGRLAASGVSLVERTCEMSVAAWTRLHVPVPTGVDPVLAIVLGGGVAWADLLSFCRVCLYGTSIPMDAARVLNESLRIEFAEQAPQMAVRDALGWMLAAGQDGRDPFVLADAWAAVDPSGGGWVFMAAGLEVAEAGPAVEAGTLDASSARVLAALTDRWVCPVG